MVRPSAMGRCCLLTSRVQWMGQPGCAARVTRALPANCAAWACRMGQMMPPKRLKRARCRSRNTPSLRCARLVRGGISSDAFRCAAISRRRCGRNRAAHRRGSASLIRCGYISIVRVYFHRYFLSLGLRIISGYRAHYYVERAECEKRR